MNQRTINQIIQTISRGYRKYDNEIKKKEKEIKSLNVPGVRMHGRNRVNVKENISKTDIGQEFCPFFGLNGNLVKF